MRQRRTFSKEFKRQVVEELLSESMTTSALCRKYNLSQPVLSNWKRDYMDGKLDNEPESISGLKHKIEQLERKVGQLTMDNELLKKVLKSANRQSQANGKYSEIISPLTIMSKGGVK